MKTIGIINGEGFESTVVEHCDGRVTFIGDADINADGANRQFGRRPAYQVDNQGSDFLANGGMVKKNGKVILAADWAKSIVILDSDGEPKVFADGVIASKTAYKFPNKSHDDPTAYVDSETVPCITVPPLVIKGVKGIVLGSRCRVTNTQNKRVVEGVVADVGPRNKIGEISIAMAKALGIPESPRFGGASEPILEYEIWPDVSATVLGVNYPLQAS